jgi:hypothetical protein
MEEPNEGVMSSIVRRDISWLWRHCIAYGHLALVEGEKGVNKGTLLLHIAARLSLGMPMPCVQDGRNRRPVSSGQLRTRNMNWNRTMTWAVRNWCRVKTDARVALGLPEKLCLPQPPSPAACHGEF